MAKIIDDETIENVCILAKLSLNEEAKEKAKEDMQKMLDMWKSWMNWIQKGLNRFHISLVIRMYSVKTW